MALEHITQLLGETRELAALGASLGEEQPGWHAKRKGWLKTLRSEFFPALRTARLAGEDHEIREFAAVLGRPTVLCWARVISRQWDDADETLTKQRALWHWRCLRAITEAALMEPSQEAAIKLRNLIIAGFEGERAENLDLLNEWKEALEALPASAFIEIINETIVAAPLSPDDERWGGRFPAVLGSTDEVLSVEVGVTHGLTETDKPFVLVPAPDLLIWNILDNQFLKQFALVSTSITEISRRQRSDHHVWRVHLAIPNRNTPSMGPRLEPVVLVGNSGGGAIWRAAVSGMMSNVPLLDHEYMSFCIKPNPADETIIAGPVGDIEAKIKGIVRLSGLQASLIVADKQLADNGADLTGSSIRLRRIKKPLEAVSAVVSGSVWHGLRASLISDVYVDIPSRRHMIEDVIDRLRRRDAWLTILTGESGSGKSVFLGRVLQFLRDDIGQRPLDDVIYIDCQLRVRTDSEVGLTFTSPSLEFAWMLFKSLRDSAVWSSADQRWFAGFGSLADVGAVLEQEGGAEVFWRRVITDLARMDPYLVLVLDNFEIVESEHPQTYNLMKSLLDVLPTVERPRLRVICLCHDLPKDLPEETHMRIQPLTEKEAVDVLAAHDQTTAGVVRNHIDHPHIGRIVRAARNNPRALAAVAGRLWAEESLGRDPGELSEEGIMSEDSMTGRHLDHLISTLYAMFEPDQKLFALLLAALRQPVLESELLALWTEVASKIADDLHSDGQDLPEFVGNSRDRIALLYQCDFLTWDPFSRTVFLPPSHLRKVESLLAGSDTPFAVREAVRIAAADRYGERLISYSSDPEEQPHGAAKLAGKSTASPFVLHSRFDDQQFHNDCRDWLRCLGNIQGDERAQYVSTQFATLYYLTYFWEGEVTVCRDAQELLKVFKSTRLYRENPVAKAVGDAIAKFDVNYVPEVERPNTGDAPSVDWTPRWEAVLAAIDELEQALNYTTDPAHDVVVMDQEEGVESEDTPIAAYTSDHSLRIMTGNYRGQALWHLRRDTRQVYQTVKRRLAEDEGILSWVYPYCAIEFAISLLNFEPAQTVECLAEIRDALNWHRQSYEEDPQSNYDMEVDVYAVDALDLLFQQLGEDALALRCAALKTAGAYALNFCGTGFYSLEEYYVGYFNRLRSDVIRRLRKAFQADADLAVSVCAQAYRDSWHAFRHDQGRTEPDFDAWRVSLMDGGEPTFIPGNQLVLNEPRDLDFDRLTSPIPQEAERVMQTLAEWERSPSPTDSRIWEFQRALIDELIGYASELLNVSQTSAQPETEESDD